MAAHFFLAFVDDQYIFAYLPVDFVSTNCVLISNNYSDGKVFYRRIVSFICTSLPQNVHHSQVILSTQSDIHDSLFATNPQIRDEKCTHLDFNNKQTRHPAVSSAPPPPPNSWLSPAGNTAFYCILQSGQSEITS